MPELLDAIDWPVRTERLTIRRTRQDDLDRTWVFRQLPEVSRWTSQATLTYAGHQAHFRRSDWLAGELVVELAGRVIGDLMIKIEDAWAQDEAAERAKGVQAELGWSLDPAFHGRGYATEAVRATVGLCFGPLGLRRVIANCFAANEPSWRLMERIGMRREAHNVRDSLHAIDGWVDGYTYALLADEWS